ncbi:ABC transporter permease [Bacillus velezensis]|uniref:ABC transporter permease n=1 Tax=Bacillus amyloliquefaciens group TaxID=1938374 RepID=UPI0014198FC7|nr:MULTISPECIES: ABC transporter permease [Bacillus amyloliquefaciens group]MBI0441399.1 ABC transporter permease [Bacillus velezensis]MCC9265189.1 ABC transporter permease [Bacillus velezensis]NIH00426.1 hypothetical protein [Bacillus amyloliquefaciens]
MNNFRVILWDTYLQKIKTKSFLIMMLLIILAGGLAANYNKLQRFFEGADEGKIAIILNSDNGKDQNYEEFIKISEKLGYKTVFEKISSLKKGKLKVENNEFTGVLVLSSEKDLQLTGSIYEKEHINKATLNQLNETLATYNMQKKAQNLKLNASDIQYISQNHIVQEKLINEDAEEKDNSLFLIYVVYGLVFLLYGSVMIFSNMIAQDIASEKSSRVMEIIMSSTKPIFHMYGKITGIGLVGITQIVTFLLTVEVFSLINKENFLQSFIDSGIDIKLLTFAIVSFLVGYLIYSLIAAVVGSIVSTIQEVQQLYLPIMLLLFFSFFISIYVTLSDQVANWIKVISFVPFFSPVIMFARYGVGAANISDILISLFINIIFIILLSFICAKLYRGAVFVYESGKLTKLLKRSLELSKSESK